ncbi:hypothetical protein ACFV0C_02515 [Streptomyces sp. NPDC059568]|uniref:hypothetical protein n=1 Tax=Streptomyces sp. NPDC059568 TaxID=3346868 RepID=UPI0036B44964
MKMLLIRIVLCSVGLAVITFGAHEFYDRARPDLGDVLGVALWLAGGVVLHDGLLVPAVLAVGLLIHRSPLRPVLRGGLLTVGSLTLIALPALLRPGPRANPTVLPSNYPLNWAITICVVLLGTACVAYATRRGRRHRREREQRSG